MKAEFVALFAVISVASAQKFFFSDATAPVPVPSFAPSAESFQSNQFFNEPAKKPIIPIVEHTQVKNPDGSYNLQYSTANGIAHHEDSQSALNAKGEQVFYKSGSYGYTAPDGTPVTISYIADAQGFRVIGSPLPVAPKADVPAGFGSAAAAPAAVSSSYPNNFGLLGTGFAPASTNFAPAPSSVVPASGKFFDSASTGVSPASTSFVPSSGSFAPASSKFTPASTNFAPASTGFVPSSGSFAPASSKFTPASTNFAPASTGFVSSPSSFVQSPSSFVSSSSSFVPSAPKFAPASSNIAPSAGYFSSEPIVLPPISN